MSNQTPRIVLTWQSALAAGHLPRDYSYDRDIIPTGEYHIILNFMIWAQKLPAVDLYCTIRQTGQRIRLTFFLDKERRYLLQGTDVTRLPFGILLIVQVEQNTHGNPTLNKVSRLPAAAKT